MVKEAFLTERARAEDIILGSLGFGEEASIVSVTILPLGFSGVGRWLDGETFEFQSDEEPSDLESWALKVLAKPGAKAA